MRVVVLSPALLLCCGSLKEIKRGGVSASPLQVWPGWRQARDGGRVEAGEEDLQPLGEGNSLPYLSPSHTHKIQLGNTFMCSY